MRYSKSPDTQRCRCSRPTRALFAALALLAAATVEARDISIDHAGSELSEGSYFADARIRFELDEDIYLALEHGVAVDIHTLFRVRRDRQWLWDPLVAESVLHYRLQHHPLSKDFVVNDEVSGERHQFPTVEAALKFMGTVSNQRLIEASLLESGSTYTGYVRARLSMESLPAPLQPAAYVSGRWQMESPWYEWVVH